MSSATEQLPAVRREPRALATIRAALGASKLIAVDDDPTGSQTVSGVPVIADWSRDELAWALTQPAPVCFVLTNSRSLPEPAAVALAEGLGRRLGTAARELGVDVRIVSRGDSTLRGHFPAETLALERGLVAAGQPPFDGVLVCPAFIEAGRITVDDVHWVRHGERFLPAAETEYARDPAFGYRSSDLGEWVAERAGERPVASIGLADIRVGGPRRVARVLAAVRGGGAVVVNAADYADLEVVTLGVLAAERRGRRFLYRTGPSFVGVRAGVPRRGPLTATELVASDAPAHGLVVVGSHTQLTNRQLDAARARHPLRHVELDVPALLGGRSAEEIARAGAEAEAALAASSVVVATSRRPADGGLEAARLVSDALVAVVRRIAGRRPLRFVVAKGGITSSDVATRGFGMARAEVAGQLFEGLVSVWRLDGGLPYVVFPGNVGDDGALADALDVLAGAR